MPDDNLFVEDQHPVSRRFVVFEDDGTTAWLYLTEPGTETPVADTWVYNRVPAPPVSAFEAYRDRPAPAPIGFASETALCRNPKDHQWSFLWSADGESVAVTKAGTPVAFIVAAQKPGYSRELIKDGPWGHTWSEELFQKTFRTRRDEG